MTVFRFISASPAPGFGFPVFGRVAVVDQINGNDVFAAVNGPPFSTVEAAIASVAAGDCVWVMPGSYDLAAGITIPDGVALRGMSRLVCTLRMLDVTADTTLLVMGENTRVEDLQLVLTSEEHHTLVGVQFSGGTAATAKVRSCQITVDNSAAPLAGGSTVQAVFSDGTGVPSEDIAAVRACNVTARSIGTGAVRALFVDTHPHLFRARDSNFFAELVDGAGTAIAAEVGLVGSTLSMRACLCDGAAPAGTPADVSQTAGVLEINATHLVNSNANGLGFTNVEKPAFLLFGAEGNLPTGDSFLSTFGSASAALQQQIQFPVQRLCKSLIVTAGAAPGVGNTCDVVVLLDAAPTPLLVQLNDAETNESELNVSFTIPANSWVGVRVTESAGAGTADLSVQLEVV